MAIQHNTLACLYIFSWTFAMVSLVNGSRSNICNCTSKLLDQSKASTKKHLGTGPMQIKREHNITSAYENTLKANWANIKVDVNNAVRSINMMHFSNTPPDICNESLPCRGGSLSSVSTRDDNLHLDFSHVLCLYNYVSAINADVVTTAKNVQGESKKLSERRRDFQKNLSDLLCAVEFVSQPTGSPVTCDASLDPLPSHFLTPINEAEKERRDCSVMYEGRKLLKILNKKWFKSGGNKRRDIKGDTVLKKDSKIKKDKKVVTVLKKDSKIKKDKKVVTVLKKDSKIKKDRKAKTGKSS